MVRHDLNTLTQRVEHVERHVEKLEGASRRIADSVTAMSLKLDTNNQQTQDIFNVANSIKGFMRVLGWVGRGVLFIGRWVVLPIVFVGAVIYAALHNGQMPVFWGDLVKLLLK